MDSTLAMTWIPPCKENEAATYEEEAGIAAAALQLDGRGTTRCGQGIQFQLSSR